MTTTYVAQFLVREWFGERWLDDEIADSEEEGRALLIEKRDGWAREDRGRWRLVKRTEEVIPC